MENKWFVIGEDIESTQEISGTPEDNCIDRMHCYFAQTAEEAYKSYMKDRPASEVSINGLGYKCGCGKFHNADGWSAAHWNITLVHTCDSCKVTNTIRRGVILKDY